MQHPDPRVQQPDRQGVEGVGAVMAPGRTVVHQQRGGQAVVPEDGGAVVPDGLAPLIATCPHPGRAPGVVLQDRQGVAAAPAAAGEMALAVPLPPVIRLVVLEALIELERGARSRKCYT